MAASCSVLSSFLLLGPAPLSAAALDPASPPGFELHPSLEMTLFASEPQVVDPVGLSFDEFGRCYVIEMRDYPLGLGTEHRPGGTIRLLEDTDGDGRADVREVVLRGFKLGVTDSNLNGLRYGLDNRIHGANGGNGGKVFSPKNPSAAVDLRAGSDRGRIYRITPKGGGYRSQESHSDVRALRIG